MTAKVGLGLESGHEELDERRRAFSLEEGVDDRADCGRLGLVDQLVVEIRVQTRFTEELGFRDICEASGFSTELLLGQGQELVASTHHFHVFSVSVLRLGVDFAGQFDVQDDNLLLLDLK
ncbi:TPA: hypothetical protein DEA21_01410 [Candidatus Uhrbacteria bacterium]|nr:hypothetical protein [Candidatus Uhrbacteria bacterium]HCU31593.1 hypothetical protein [Candidatus Uhrbacteria bacterium]